MTSTLICFNLGLTRCRRLENYIFIFLRVQHNAKCLGKIIYSTRGRSSDLINATYPFFCIVNGSWWLPLDGFPAGWIQIDKRLKIHLSLILRLWIWCCVWHWVSWFLPIPLVWCWKECCTPWIKTPHISFSTCETKEKSNKSRPCVYMHLRSRQIYRTVCYGMSVTMCYQIYIYMYIFVRFPWSWN